MVAASRLIVNLNKVYFYCSNLEDISVGTVSSPSWNFSFVASYGSKLYAGFFKHGSAKRVNYSVSDIEC